MDIGEILATDFSDKFIRAMQDRMVTSFYKYGPVAEAAGNIDEIASLKARLANYEATGNTEWLVDVANFAMIEYMQPQHPNAHFRATESNESPGRVFVPDEFDGSVEVSARANDGSIAIK
jgi:hypothetical protein